MRRLEFRPAKPAEIQAGQEQTGAKTQQLATTDEKLAGAKENLGGTKRNLSACDEFLMMLKEKYSSTDAEWDERQKSRRDQ